jgi:hypothetical protein
VQVVAPVRVPLVAEGRAADEEDESALVPATELRANNVTDKGDAVWAHRGARDVYTLSQRRPANPNVDHILEIQLLERAAREAPPAGATRGVYNAVNDVINLNVTTSRINQSKKGPFTSFLNRMDRADTRGERSLEQYARTSCPHLVDLGHWARIEGAVVRAYEDVDTALQARRAPPATQLLLDELHSILQRMQLNGM